MIKFTKERVLLLHKFITEATGTPGDLRDSALLDSALESAFHTFDGKELYPSKEEKAARITCSLINNHPFTDGNKRIGMYFLLTFLSVNGINLDCSNQEIVDLGFAVAAGEAGYEEILNWVAKHKII